ncbi:MAG: UDP-N-acetylmuramoyl-L-alanine--D-glutamate ligase [Fimbriimonadaceae bacterium]|nr:UDP-N-acetylmuramoyl-L-alanine--D-glutamate ligase [Fimbriimonadaceae bacterium]
MDWSNLRIAVAGMGRSGIGIAQAAKKRGARPTVFDEQSAESESQFEAIEKLQGQGIEVVTGWHGRLDPQEFDLLVASPGFRREHPAIRDMLHGDREVISEVEFAYRIAESPILAITGTNGKSTTTVLTWLLLQGAGQEAILCGNVSGSGYDELTLTEAADLGPGKVLVAEVSSYQLEWVRDFRPRVAAITNITPDHMDRHPTFEDYFQTKLRIFAAMGESDIAVVNENEPSLPIDAVLAALPPEVGVRTFSVALESNENQGTHSGHSTHQSTRVEPELLVLGGRKVRRQELPLYGDHNAINAAMAWEMAVAYLATEAERQWEPMLRTLAEFKGLAHRMERLGSRGDVLVVNNSMCTNPKAVIASSRSLPLHQHLLMGGQTKQLDFSSVKEYLVSSGHKLYLFGQDGDGLFEQLGDVGSKYSSMEDAFAAATQAAKPGEAILLSPGCASAYPFPNFRERGEAFRRMAQYWLDHGSIEAS